MIQGMLVHGRLVPHAPQPQRIPPVVPMRGAEFDELPQQVKAFLQILELLDLHYGDGIVCTYAQGGPERPQPQTGQCGECEREVLMTGDGSLRVHNVPQLPKCSGVGLEVRERDVSNGKAMCTDCFKVVKVSKKLTITTHTPPVQQCVLSGKPPEKVLPIKVLPPVCSVALRVHIRRDRWAVGVWYDGEYEEGWVFDDVALFDLGKPIGTQKMAKAVKVTEFETYLRNITDA